MPEASDTLRGGSEAKREMHKYPYKYRDCLRRPHAEMGLSIGVFTGTAPASGWDWFRTRMPTCR